MRALLPLLLFIQRGFTATCFLNETSTTPYVAMGVTIEESIKWCYTACADATGCTSVVYDDKDGSCVKLSNSPVLNPLLCHAPYTRYYMSDVGCPYGDTMANMGTDPCARHMPFLLEYLDDGTNKICPQRRCDSSEGPPIIIRYRDEAGALKSFDNSLKNWKLFYKDGYGNFTAYATAIACAEITNAAACPCAPLAVYSEPNLNPKGPLLTDTLPACPPPYYPKVIMKNAKSATRTLENPNMFMATCMGGMWVACFNGQSNINSMNIGGCGTG